MTSALGLAVRGVRNTGSSAGVWETLHTGDPGRVGQKPLLLQTQTGVSHLTVPFLRDWMEDCRCWLYHRCHFSPSSKLCRHLEWLAFLGPVLTHILSLMDQPWDRLQFVRSHLAMATHVCHLYTGIHLKIYHLHTGNNKTWNNLQWLQNCYHLPQPLTI